MDVLHGSDAREPAEIRAHTEGTQGDSTSGPRVLVEATRAIAKGQTGFEVLSPFTRPRLFASLSEGSERVRKRAAA